MFGKICDNQVATGVVRRWQTRAVTIM